MNRQEKSNKMCVRVNSERIILCNFHERKKKENKSNACIMLFWINEEKTNDIEMKNDKHLNGWKNIWELIN